MPAPSIRLLQRRLSLIERRPASAAGVVRTGHDALDRALGGGVARGRLHELFAFDAEEAGSAAGFAAALARRLGAGVLWLREEAAERRGGLYAEGLAEIGLDPARLILGVLPDAQSLLRAAADALRCPEIGVTVIELWGAPRLLDLTASRRLALAAEGSGVTALMLRIAAEPAPSACQTRWRIAPAPSVALAANAPGAPAWTIELLRQRGRPPGGPWRVEWRRDEAAFSESPALPGALVPLSADRPGGADSPAGLRRAS